MKILVTGGAGFIGSNIVDTYIGLGHQVVVVDNLTTGKRENVHPKAELYEVDIRNRESLERVFATENPQVVSHHAAQKSVVESMRNPLFDLQVNGIGFLNVLQSCHRYGVKKFIFASSGGALAGDSKEVPTTETSPPKLTSPYALTKYMGEKYLEFFSTSYGLSYTALRYANVYGPRQDADSEGGVIAIFLNNVLQNRRSTIFTYPDMPDGMLRDYVFIDDVCRANVLALDSAIQGVFHVGGGQEITTKDLYSLIERVSGSCQASPRLAASRPGEVRRSWLDLSLTKSHLNWAPTTSLEEGIRKTRDFFQKR